MVSKEKLEKFKRLYELKYNISISNEEATKMATDLINLMQVLLKPDSPEESAQSNKSKGEENETITTQTP